MSTTCKLPRRVLRVAYAVGQDALPDYTHRFSPKKFTQPQLFACLVLKVFLKTDYRGVTAFLQDLPDLPRAIGLKDVPHFTTLQKAAARLLRHQRVGALLTATVSRAMQRRKCVPLAAADSSGFDITQASRYYVWRAKRLGSPRKHMTYRHFAKLGLICNTHDHLILAMFPGRGPSPDVHQLKHLLRRLTDRVSVAHLLADAGYDSEANHRLLRETYGIRSTIPPKHGRPRKDGRPPTGRYRRLMKQRFDQRAYRQRSQVETVMSMIKRNLDAGVRAKSYWAQCRELVLKGLTHNIMIIRLRIKVFYRAGISPIIRLIPARLCCVDVLLGRC